jgi:choline dehydrogenase
MATFDYVIVGAGSAGCVLANRLSEDSACQVLLLEAGGEDTSALIRTPGLYPMLQDSAVDWGFRTVAQPQLNGRRIFSPRGKVLGGSSSINYMMFVRGNVRDYDNWSDLGNPGWEFECVLPYFKRLEDTQDAVVDDAWHGRGGPVFVTRDPALHPLASTYLEAAVAAGLPLNQDFAGASQIGCGQYWQTIRDGRRWSAADAYLRPAVSRPNLTVAIRSYATRLLFDRAGVVSGVETIQGGAFRHHHAAREVILAAGAFNSPRLLLLSGIGPARELERIGVKVEWNLPGVGKNLRDHLSIRIGCEVTQPLSFGALTAQDKAAAMAEYERSQSGPLAGNFLQVGGFAPISPGETWPSLQLFFSPTMPKPFPEDGPSRTHGMMFVSSVNRPHSHGEVTLASSDPLDPPIINPRYLSDAKDMEVAIAGVRWNQEILSGRAFDTVRGKVTFPSAMPKTTDEIMAHVRADATTIWHVCGTCKMGTDDAAVVDPELRVRGLERLRVVDASVMPQVVSANTHATVMMIAEKASDLIRKRAPVGVGPRAA